MKFEIMEASEARALAEDCKVTVTDEHIAGMVRGISERIAYTARSGKFMYKIHVDDLFGMVWLNDPSVKDQQSPILTIIRALRSAGYTAELGANFVGTSCLHIVIKW